MKTSFRGKAQRLSLAQLVAGEMYGSNLGSMFITCLDTGVVRRLDNLDLLG